MKLIIDIPEEMISLIKDKSVECFNIIHYGQVLDAIHNGTPIPDNATNGDVIKAIISLSESAYKEMRENGIDNVDYDIRQMMKNAVIIERSLCDSCVTKGCIFQSGIVRSHCDFYKAESEEQTE